MKNIFTLLLVIVASTGTMLAAEKIGDFYYNLNSADKTAEVYSYVGGSSAVIPSSVQFGNVTYSVTSIASRAFENSAMTSITIPESIKSIGKWAFEECISLTSVVWNVVKLDKEPFGSTFFDSENINSFTFGNDVEAIPDYLCHALKMLTTITIPSNVKSIGLESFANSGLTSVTLSEGITSIGKQAFEQCENLISINIPASVTYIGTYAFKECKKLESSIIIPEGITTLSNGVFINCSSLTTISLPSSLERIEGTYFGTFAGCNALEKIFVHRDTPANADSKTFDGVDKYSCTLYVPRTSISLYESAPVWRDFYNIEAIEDAMAIDEVEVDCSHGQKIIRDGQVLIERGDKAYTLQGAEVK